MRQSLFGWTALALTLVAVPLHAAEQKQTAQTVTLQVVGMIPGTGPRVEDLLKKLPGVSQVKASEAMGAVLVVYDPAKAKTQDFTQTLQKAGYLSQLAKVNYQCPHCRAGFQDDGICPVCEVSLEPVQKG